MCLWGGARRDAPGLLQVSAPGALPMRMLLDPDPCCRGGSPPAARIRASAGPGICFLVCQWALQMVSGSPSSCTSSSSALVIFVAWTFPGPPHCRLCDPSNLSCRRPCSTRAAPSAEVVVHVVPAGSGTPPGAAAACPGLCPPPPSAAQVGLLRLREGRLRAQNRGGPLRLETLPGSGAALTVVADC